MVAAGFAAATAFIVQSPKRKLRLSVLAERIHLGSGKSQLCGGHVFLEMLDRRRTGNR